MVKRGPMGCTVFDRAIPDDIEKGIKGPGFPIENPDLGPEANSDDFVFDNQMLAQVLWGGHTIAEVSCPTKYFAEASSINFRRSTKYGFGCLATARRCCVAPRTS